MKLVLYSLTLNHHQAPVADALYEQLSNDFCFVELAATVDKKGSTTDYSKRPYLLKAWVSDAEYKVALTYARDADVCIFSGVESLPFEIERLKLNRLSFDMGERILKRGLLNLASPRILKMAVSYFRYSWYQKPLYKLCCSAFAAKDLNGLGMFKNKCYKWGYFTEAPNLDVEKILEARRSVSKIRILAIARFLFWKHHELSVQCVRNLLDKGYDVELDIYGNGPEFEDISSMIDDLNLNDKIFLKGNLPNKELLEEIRKHDIFLFTSDRNEGWGAVVNEAMSNACPVVGSDAVGSVPFLINDGQNGLIFKSGDIDALTQKVEILIKDCDLREKLARNAYYTLHDVWSPANAARCLLDLIDCLLVGRTSEITEGPCSPAYPYYG